MLSSSPCRWYPCWIWRFPNPSLHNKRHRSPIVCTLFSHPPMQVYLHDNYLVVENPPLWRRRLNHEKEKFACLRACGVLAACLRRARGVLAACLRRACGVLACLRACLRPPGPHWPPAPPQSFKLLWAPVRGYDLILTVLGNDLNLTVLVFCVIWRAQ